MIKEILNSSSKYYRYIAIAFTLVVVLFLAVNVFIYLRETSTLPSGALLPEETPNINDVTAPEGKGNVTKEMIEGVSAPKETKPSPVPEDVLKNLTAPK